MQVTSHSLAETNAFAENFVKEITKRLSDRGLNRSTAEKRKAEVIALSGDLGAGKTAFVKCAAKCFGIEDDITSPTFIIEKIYKLKDDDLFRNFIHIDAYRLESGKELLHLGWNDLVSDPKNIIFVEWPEKVADVMPLDAKIVKFEFIDDNTRHMSYEKN